MNWYVLIYCGELGRNVSKKSLKIFLFTIIAYCSLQTHPRNPHYLSFPSFLVFSTTWFLFLASSFQWQHFKKKTLEYTIFSHLSLRNRTSSPLPQSSVVFELSSTVCENSQQFMWGLHTCTSLVSLTRLIVWITVLEVRNHAEFQEDAQLCMPWIASLLPAVIVHLLTCQVLKQYYAIAFTSPLIVSWFQGDSGFSDAASKASYGDTCPVHAKSGLRTTQPHFSHVIHGTETKENARRPHVRHRWLVLLKIRSCCTVVRCLSVCACVCFPLQSVRFPVVNNNRGDWKC